MCEFIVGQKVVCVSVTPEDWRSKGCVYPVIGGQYTIGKVTTCFFDGTVIVSLKEIGEQIAFLDGRTCWLCFPASAFRPLTARKTDISVFTDMLQQQKQPVAQ